MKRLNDKYINYELCSKQLSTFDLIQISLKFLKSIQKETDSKEEYALLVKAVSSLTVVRVSNGKYSFSREDASLNKHNLSSNIIADIILENFIFLLFDYIAPKETYFGSKDENNLYSYGFWKNENTVKITQIAKTEYKLDSEYIYPGFA